MDVQQKNMEYEDFFKRAMGACRRKHLPRQKTFKQHVREILMPWRRPDPNRPGIAKNGSRYRIPSESVLGRDFIRMEPWEIEYIFAIARYADTAILETGRFNGGSCFIMSCANSKVPIYSIDIAPQDDDLLRQKLAENGVGQNAQLIVGDSQGGEYPNIKEIDLLFVDGEHTYKGCMADLEQWFPRVKSGGHILVHDCYFGTEVQPAVIDFAKRHDVEFFQGPYVSASHWRSPAGSLAHFRKR